MALSLLQDSVSPPLGFSLLTFHSLSSAKDEQEDVGSESVALETPGPAAGFGANDRGNGTCPLNVQSNDGDAHDSLPVISTDGPLDYHPAPNGFLNGTADAAAVNRNRFSDTTSEGATTARELKVRIYQSMARRESCCYNCDADFTKQPQLRLEHVWVKHAPKLPYDCGKCYFAGENYKAVANHSAKMHGAKVTPNIRGPSFAQLQRLGVILGRCFPLKRVIVPTNGALQKPSISPLKSAASRSKSRSSSKRNGSGKNASNPKIISKSFDRMLCRLCNHRVAGVSAKSEHVWNRHMGGAKPFTCGVCCRYANCKKGEVEAHAKQMHPQTPIKIKSSSGILVRKYDAKFEKCFGRTNVDVSIGRSSAIQTKQVNTQKTAIPHEKSSATLEEASRSPLVTALLDSTETQCQVFLTPKEEPGSVSHAVAGTENIIHNEFTVKVAPEASVLLAAEALCWVQTSSITGELYSCIATSGTYQTMTPGRLKVNCSLFYRGLFLRDISGAGRQQRLDNLLEVRQLPADYAIPKLAGQRGVFAKTRIAADTVLGLYAGIILNEGSDDAKSRDLQAELSYLDGVNPGAFYTEPFLSKYAVDLPLCADFMKRNKDCRLTVSALQRGNCLSLINGYRKADDIPGLLTSARLNTASTIVRMDGNIPIILLYASKDIAADDQLFLDYGAAYFKPLPQPIIIDRCDIADASEIGWINRFVRDANDATGDFVLPLATIDDLEKVTAQLFRENVGQFSVCVGSMTLKISSANMAAAISKQQRIPADTIEEEVTSKSASSTAKAPWRGRIKRLATGKQVKHFSQLFSAMAIVKLTDTWVLENYAEVFEASKVGESKFSPPLAALGHFAFPGLTWRMELYPRGNSRAMPDFASVFVEAFFGPEKESVGNVWAMCALTIVASAAHDNLQLIVEEGLYLEGGCHCWGRSSAFSQDDLKGSVRKDGHLQIKLDLTIFKIVDLLKCRETVRALLSDNRLADVTVKVAGDTFKAHKAILAERCSGFVKTAPAGTKAETFAALLGAVYSDNFEFLAKWELSLGVLHLANNFLNHDLAECCDVALAEMVPSVTLANLLQILPVACRYDALATKSAIISRLAEESDLAESPEWTAFKKKASKEIALWLFETLQKIHINDIPESTLKFHAPEIKLSHVWKVPNAELVKAIGPRPKSVTSPAFLQHNAFPLLTWQLEFHPRGNTQDKDYQPGFASLYLKAIFGPAVNDLKAVFAKWKATIIPRDGKQMSVPESPDYILFTGAKEMQIGCANAFRFEDFKIDAGQNNSLQIRLDLTIASIPEILKCRDLFSSLHSDKRHADFKINVVGTIFTAHKFILAARSPVFAGMFYANMEENKTGKVDVKDATPEAFTAFMAALYYENWDFLSDMDATIDVLKLAEKYGVADLKRYCDETLAHFATKPNVLKILPQATMHNAEAATKACIEILFASEEMLTSREWVAFKKANEKIAFDIAEAVGERYRKALKRKREEDD